MDNNIHFIFFKHDKNIILYILENMHKKLLEFDRMHKNKTYLFVFLK
jgi:hypothetical protein